MAVNRLKEHFGLPVLRASRLVELQRPSFYYRSKFMRDQSAIIHRMKELVTHHKSWGYSMIHDVLKRKPPFRAYKSRLAANFFYLKVHLRNIHMGGNKRI